MPTAATPTKVPCRSQDPDLWFSDHDTDRALAMHLCLTHCPLLDLCRTANQQPAHGVWAGVLYTANGHVDQRRLNPADRDTCPDCPNRDHRADATTYPDCGTRAAWKRHNKNHERPCDPCRDANREWATRRRGDRQRASSAEAAAAKQRLQQQAQAKAEQRHTERQQIAERVRDLAGRGNVDPAIGEALGLPSYTVRRIRRINKIPPARTHRTREAA